MPAQKQEIVTMIRGVLGRTRNTIDELTRAIAFATEYQLSQYIPQLKGRLQTLMRHQLHEEDVVEAAKAGIVVGDTGTYENSTGIRRVKVHTIDPDRKLFKLQYIDRKPASVFEASPRKVQFDKQVVIPFRKLDLD